jgi:hypothetical protein
MPQAEKGVRGKGRQPFAPHQHTVTRSAGQRSGLGTRNGCLRFRRRFRDWIASVDTSPLAGASSQLAFCLRGRQSENRVVPSSFRAGCWGSMERKTGLRLRELCSFRFSPIGVRRDPGGMTRRFSGLTCLEMARFHGSVIEARSRPYV